VAEYRAAIHAEATPADVRRVMRKLIELAARGDTAAAKVVLERTAGRVPVTVAMVDAEESRGEPDLAYL
jgi:hypothetical protein